MKGQWIGKCEGSSNGTIFVNVDELSSHFEGVAHLVEDNVAMPGSAAFFSTVNLDRNFKFRTNNICPIDPRTHQISLWDNVKHLLPADIRMPEYVDVDGSWSDETLTLNWKSSLGTFGNSILPKSNAGKPSLLAPKIADWDLFKKLVAEEKLVNARPLFRGQRAPWRLRTAYHRTGRANLYRFMAQDVRVLHKHLSGQTKRLFNLSVPDESGSFFNLLQHHGYPTPLLDWSYSPYVAAFFAYRGVTNTNSAAAGANDKVRIHIFDQGTWQKDWEQLHNVLVTKQNFSVEDFLSLENARMIPQQSVSTLTNVDDVESYIKTKESNGKNYLWAIDLPVNERNKVMKELTYMGITAGSMFPGLDGACEELKERNFDI